MFQEKTVLVTGAAGALGSVLVKKFASAGAVIVAVDIAGDALRNLKTSLPLGARTIALDLLDREKVTSVLGNLDVVDILCNVAGAFRMGPPVHHTGPELWHGMMDLNATSLINVSSAILPGMISRGSGKVVNVGALSALAGKPNMGAYTAAKAAVIRITESMAAELKMAGINVNCVLPGIIDTPANRMEMPAADYSKWVTTDALCDVIMFLASSASRAVHGAAIPVAGRA